MTDLHLTSSTLFFPVPLRANKVFHAVSTLLKARVSRVEELSSQYSGRIPSAAGRAHDDVMKEGKSDSQKALCGVARDDEDDDISVGFDDDDMLGLGGEEEEAFNAEVRDACKGGEMTPLLRGLFGVCVVGSKGGVARGVKEIFNFSDWLKEGSYWDGTKCYVGGVEDGRRIFGPYGRGELCFLALDVLSREGTLGGEFGEDIVSSILGDDVESEEEESEEEAKEGDGDEVFRKCSRCMSLALERGEEEDSDEDGVLDRAKRGFEIFGGTNAHFTKRSSLGSITIKPRQEEPQNLAIDFDSLARVYNYALHLSRKDACILRTLVIFSKFILDVALTDANVRELLPMQASAVAALFGDTAGELPYSFSLGSQHARSSKTSASNLFGWQSDRQIKLYQRFKMACDLVTRIGGVEFPDEYAFEILEKIEEALGESEAEFVRSNIKALVSDGGGGRAREGFEASDDEDDSARDNPLDAKQREMGRHGALDIIVVALQYAESCVENAVCSANLSIKAVEDDSLDQGLGDALTLIIAYFEFRYSVAVWPAEPRGTKIKRSVARRRTEVVRLRPTEKREDILKLSDIHKDERLGKKVYLLRDPSK